MKKLKFLLSRYLDRKKNDSFVDMKKIKKIFSDLLKNTIN